MAVIDQEINGKFALYNGDCVEVMKSMPDACIHLSIYSPPFATPGGGALYHYSSSERDLSNCDSYENFFDHYGYVVREIARLTVPGRMTAIHCMDVPTGNSGHDGLVDFPGDIIRLHRQNGWSYISRHAIWKEPLAVRLRTLQKNLAHRTLVDDSADCGVAGADYLLVFRRDGDNTVPISHPQGLFEYAGATSPPSDILRYRGMDGDQKQNRFSHWIWRRYASSIWDDVRIGRVLPYRECKEEQDEKHVHPLQLDVIERCVTLRSNPGETVLTPFMGVGSEVYVPVLMGRRAVGIELKSSYYRQAVKNCVSAANGNRDIIANEVLDFGMDDENDMIFPSIVHAPEEGALV